MRLHSLRADSNLLSNTKVMCHTQSWAMLIQSATFKSMLQGVATFFRAAYLQGSLVRKMRVEQIATSSQGVYSKNRLFWKARTRCHGSYTTSRRKTWKTSRYTTLLSAKYSKKQTAQADWHPYQWKGEMTILRAFQGAWHLNKHKS